MLVLHAGLAKRKRKMGGGRLHHHGSDDHPQDGIHKSKFNASRQKRGENGWGNQHSSFLGSQSADVQGSCRQQSRHFSLKISSKCKGNNLQLLHPVGRRGGEKGRQQVRNLQGPFGVCIFDEVDGVQKGDGQILTALSWL